MIVKIRLEHKNERRVQQLEIWGINPQDVAIILEDDSPKIQKFKQTILDRFVRQYCTPKIPPGYEMWNFVDWEFVDISEAKVREIRDEKKDARRAA